MTHPGGTRLRTILVAVAAAMALVIAASVGFLWGRADNHIPGPSAVDVGFARDMSTHHEQAIAMAGHVRDTTTDKRVRATAFDIETAQISELGAMTGWLAERDISPNVQTPMTWMAGHDHLTNGLMPGMATPAQMRSLLGSSGHRMDVLFLQLMLRHHQGGIEMAKYASEHASSPYLRDLATRMYGVQAGEIVNIEQLLRQLGGVPLAPPT